MKPNQPTTNNGMSNFIGYLMPKPCFFMNSNLTIAGRSYLSQEYLSESGLNCGTRVRTRSPVIYPLPNGTNVM